MDIRTSDAVILSEPENGQEAEWQAFLAQAPDSTASAAATQLHELYGPLRTARNAGLFAVGHLAQSLDGRIATVQGSSRWLSGGADLLHTHRMRALADAVIVGVNTVLADDPQLTVRMCAGKNPVRVVIDPERRLDGGQRIFHDGAAPTLVLAAEDKAQAGEKLGHAEVLTVARSQWGLDPRAIRDVLARRGLTALFIEGGGITVSRFLVAGMLDRLQMTVVPLILGSGRPSIVLPEITDLGAGLRPRTRRFVLGDDIMIEFDFRD